MIAKKMKTTIQPAPLSATIRPEQLQVVLVVWSYYEVSSRFTLGDTIKNLIANEILRPLRGIVQGVTRIDSCDRFQLDKNAVEIHLTLNVLRELNMNCVEILHIGGVVRSTKTWFWYVPPQQLIPNNPAT